MYRKHEYVQTDTIIKLMVYPIFYRVFWSNFSLSLEDTYSQDDNMVKL